MRLQAKTTRRDGRLYVELALVIGLFLLFLFGIFEYTRFLFVQHMVNNAVRDGARYAVVNTDKPVNFDTTDYTDPAGRVYTNIKTYTQQAMAGADKQLTGMTISVFVADPTALAQTPPVVQARSPAVAWNAAPFGDKIAVTATGTYTPLLPSFLMMPSSVTVTATALMGSEG
jgi:Flp pilus assembly protein TadG